MQRGLEVIKQFHAQLNWVFILLINYVKMPTIYSLAEINTTSESLKANSYYTFLRAIGIPFSVELSIKKFYNFEPGFVLKNLNLKRAAK